MCRWTNDSVVRAAGDGAVRQALDEDFRRYIQKHKAKLAE